ncbi:hypothetical protein QUF63_08915 [Anaerolineales bacterium HSG25]|nr:hypothetical protein [Anaerolineales bacterium HSG25]
MKPTLTFEHGHVTIELSPYQCATLAKACQFASEKSLDPDIDGWRTLAALFHACTMVGLSQWHMSQAQLDALQEQLVSLGMGSHAHQAGHERRNGHQH